MLTFRYTGADGAMTVYETLTSGMVGKEVKLEFSSDWENLRKAAVFMAGTITKDRVNVTDLTTIPHEVLVNAGEYLCVGVYGVSEDGTQITPTIYARGPKIREGADPSGDESTDPTLPVWAQLDQRMTKMEQEGTGNGSSGSSQDVYILGEGETVDEAPAGAVIIIDPNDPDEETDEPATQKWVTAQITAAVNATWEASY